MEMCTDSPAQMEIPEGIDLRTLDGYSRSRTTAAAIVGRATGFSLVFVHADGGADPNRARIEHVGPIGAGAPETMRVIPVVPTRETEAWILADRESLRVVMNASEGTLNQAGAPKKPAHVEQVTDPKAVLNSLASQSSRRGQRRPIPFGRLGECISLEALRAVASFASLESDLMRALRSLGVLKEGA